MPTTYFDHRLPRHTMPPRAAKSIETKPASKAVKANGRAFGFDSMSFRFQFVASFRASQPIIAVAAPGTSRPTSVQNTTRSTMPVTQGGTRGTDGFGLGPRLIAPRSAYKKNH